MTTKKPKKQIEVEFRSMFDLKKYKKIKNFLEKYAQDLGEDDKDVYFFILPDKLLKVVNEVSKKTAKIVLKLNKIGKGSDFEEIEIPINPQDIEKAVKLFKLLGFSEIQNSFQKRHNYNYKGVDLALKYSEVWGYHLELEMVVNSIKEKKKAEEKIKKVAQELGVKLMTDEELRDFTSRVDQEYRNGLR